MLSGTAGCQLAPGRAGGLVCPWHCVYLELLIHIHKHDHINRLPQLQALSPPSTGTSSPFPFQMSRYLCSSIRSAPWLRMGKWLEKGKRQRMGEAMSLEAVTDTHCHHNHLQSHVLKMNRRHLLNRSMSSAGKACSPRHR